MSSLPGFNRAQPSASAWPSALAFALLAVAGPACSDDRAAPITPSTTADAAADASGPSSACPAENVAVDPGALLDDFEHAGSVAPLIGGRSGGWYASNDMTQGGIMQPSGDAAPEAIPGGRCASRHALHVTGAGFDLWGAVVSVAMHWGPNASGVYEEQPYDVQARGYKGLSFFARVGDTSTTTVRFAVSDQFSRPEAGLCNLADKNCYDTYGIVMSHDLSTQWT